MPKITRAAYFEVCKGCKCHGHIVFSDGSMGKEVTTEADALLQVVQARKDNKIPDVEISFLKEQIIGSDLSPIAVSTMLDAIAEMAPNACSETPANWCDFMTGAAYQNGS